MIDNKLILENSKKLMVLYVEDDKAVRETTKGLLDTYFQLVHVAVDGEDGYKQYLAYFKEHNNYYDIVITDIKMPKLDGIEMCKRMQSLNEEQSIIVISAFDELVYLHAAIELGVDGFIDKPLNIEQFKRTLYKTSQKLVDKQVASEYYEQIEELNLLHIDQIDARHLNVAQDIIDDLKEHKENISLAWCANSIVQERLRGHEIDIEYFRTHFGMKVIEYFIGVVDGTAEIGNCPVVFIMLDYFKQKDLPLHDIFMICVHFKNTLDSYIFNRYTFNQTLFDDVNIIVDKNFEGVVKNYLIMKNSVPSTTLKEEEIDEAYLSIQLDPSEEITSYVEYVLEHDVYELQDLEEDIDNLAILVSSANRVSYDDIVLLGSYIKRYGNILTNYHLFSKLGTSIFKLGVAFQDNAKLLFDSSIKRTNITILLEGFVNDLLVWRKEIFENNIEDPYFLNDSIFSNVDTIIMFMEYDDKAVIIEDKIDDVDFFDF